MRRLHLRSIWLGALGALSLVGAAHADSVSAKLNSLETEARQIGTDLPQPQLTTAANQRKLVDAVVQYHLGNYSQSALALFDIVGAKTLVGPELEQASFYLAESLYQKGDRGAARGYYTALTAPTAASGKYYQASLIRLIEIAIHQKADAADELAALDHSGASTPQVPYIKGKYAFANDKFDDAINYFNQVPKGSTYELEALYFTATANVAKKDLPHATQLFNDLSTRHPKTANDRRVIELSQVALGRLYYEQDQFGKSIDSYLLVDRKSDLFSDSLYEVAWVYVKNKQFDKALRALELLSESDPASVKTPTVKLLEGNLRIRKAQMIRQAEITGTLDAGAKVPPETEYDKASALFAELHATYAPAYEALAAIVDGKADPTPYVLQIAGRSTSSFSAVSPLPDIAAQWLREQPDVERYASVESDLGEIQSNIDEAEATVTRLEAVLAAKDKSNLYPALSQRRNRIGQMQDDLIKVRSQLADDELRLIDSNGELSQLSGNRKTLVAQYLNLGDPEKAFQDRVTKNHADFDAIDTATGEVSQAMDQAKAMAVAIRKFAVDSPSTGDHAMPTDQRTNIATTLDQVAQESVSIDAELESIRKELALGRDLSSSGDDTIIEARGLRKQVKDALDAEHRVLAGFAGSSRDSGKSRSLAGLGDQAARISQSLDQTTAQIDAIVDRNVTQTNALLVQERATIAELRVELTDVEAEAKLAGSTVVAASFATVKEKLYDVVIRADVGTVDVSWAEKSDTDDDLKRFGLNRSREIKQLTDEFKDIIDGGIKKPSAPKKVEDMPKPSGDPAISPDKGGGSGNRVAPVGDQSKKPVDPKVKPDANKKDPKKDPKKGTP